MVNKQDRSSLIKLASALPKGSEERKAILSGLQKTSGQFQFGWDQELKTTIDKLKSWRAASIKATKAFSDMMRKYGDQERSGGGMSWQEWVDEGAPMDQVLSAAEDAGIIDLRGGLYEAYMASLSNNNRRYKYLNDAIKSLEELQW